MLLGCRLLASKRQAPSLRLRTLSEWGQVVCSCQTWEPGTDAPCLACKCKCPCRQLRYKWLPGRARRVERPACSYRLHGCLCWQTQHAANTEQVQQASMVRGSKLHMLGLPMQAAAGSMAGRQSIGQAVGLTSCHAGAAACDDGPGMQSNASDMAMSQRAAGLSSLRPAVEDGQAVSAAAAPVRRALFGQHCSARQHAACQGPGTVEAAAGIAAFARPVSMAGLLMQLQTRCACLSACVTTAVEHGGLALEAGQATQKCVGSAEVSRTGPPGAAHLSRRSRRRRRCSSLRAADAPGAPTSTEPTASARSTVPATRASSWLEA